MKQDYWSKQMKRITFDEASLCDDFSLAWRPYFMAVASRDMMIIVMGTHQGVINAPSTDHTFQSISMHINACTCKNIAISLQLKH